MYLFHSTVYVKPGREAEFEASHGEPDEQPTHAPGFIRRMLLKDNEHPGRYFFMAFWETLEQLKQYRNWPETQARVARINAADLMARPVERVECDLVHLLG